MVQQLEQGPLCPIPPSKQYLLPLQQPPLDTVPIFGFWPQKLIHNSSLNQSSWEQWPINLAGASQQGDGWLELFGDIFKLLKLENLWDKFGPQLETFLSGLLVLFQIPSDADDSSVVMGLDRYLAALKTQLPSAKELWDAQRYNFSKAFIEYGKYSYCINSPDTDKNLIDPRTYWWAHKYLNNLTDPDECIVSTWMQYTSTMKEITLGTAVGPQMPLNVNNLDPTVGANALYAMSSSLLHTNETAWFDFHPDLRKLYTSTAKFVSHALNTQIAQKRPDMELLYYPPELNIVWFVARHVKMLQSFLDTSAFPHMEVGEVFNELSTAVRVSGVEYLLSRVVRGAELCGLNSSSSADVVCWDGFLGQADTDFKNESTPHYEDRYCNTAVAVVALLDAFTTSGGSMAKLEWLNASSTTPGLSEANLTLVKSLVASGINYLEAALTANHSVFENAFFSGSGKYWEQYPFWYPANYKFNWKTNSTINCSQHEQEVHLADDHYWMIFGASGKISQEEFVELAKIGCIGVAAPTWFTGYNGVKGVEAGKAWPYWSAPVLSYAIAMQAMAKFRALAPPQ